MRVLHVLDSLNRGGCESYIMNLYRHIDREKIQFDFLIRSKTNFYSEEIEKLGGRVYYTAKFPKHFIKNYFNVKKFFNEHDEYQIVHVHLNSLIYLLPIVFAKKGGVKCRIVHSHSTFTLNRAAQYIHKFNKKIIVNWATDYMACSDEAGKWAFGNNYIVMKNGIDTQKFSFDPELRNVMREKMNYAADEIIIGNVGRLSKEKNQIFLIEIMKSLVETMDKYKLLLVGDGDEREKLQKLIQIYHLEEKVNLVGGTSQAELFYQVMDVFALPSLFEGLGIVLLEAQCSGLPCIVSEAVSAEGLLQENVCKIPLNSMEQWRTKIREMTSNEQRENRISGRQTLIEHGYDILQSTLKMENYYNSKYECR